jgi:hypothetical protein
MEVGTSAAKMSQAQSPAQHEAGIMVSHAAWSGAAYSLIIINISFGIGAPLWFRIGTGGFPKHKPAHTRALEQESPITQESRH